MTDLLDVWAELARDAFSPVRFEVEGWVACRDSGELAAAILDGARPGLAYYVGDVCAIAVVTSPRWVELAGRPEAEEWFLIKGRTVVGDASLRVRTAAGDLDHDATRKRVSAVMELLLLADERQAAEPDFQNLIL